jgi:hypothetical protein
MYSRIILIGLCVLCSSTEQVSAQFAVQSIRPSTCQWGGTTELTVAGTGFALPLQVATTTPGVEIATEVVDAQTVKLRVTIPESVPLGPFGIWFAAHSGPVEASVLLVDDLPVAVDTPDNHSLETAQDVPTAISIDGVSDGAKSDFYQFRVEANQRVAFEVVSQQIGSAMDPVLRLLDAAGNVIRQADDSAVGPDCIFSHTFIEAGDYVLEVQDSRYAAGGAYHLRIGDFPVVSSAQPLAVSAKQAVAFRFVGKDAEQTATFELAVNEAVEPGLTETVVTVPAKLVDGHASKWVRVLRSALPVFDEAVTPAEGLPQVLQPPVLIHGCLSAPVETDIYWIAGKKGQTIRIVATARGLDCPTLLRMQLFSPAGAKVAETPVNESDQWSFDYAIPEDGQYRLQLNDLLKRGSDEFGYVVQVVTAGRFSVSVKADVNHREIFPIEMGVGACPLDLQVSRFGYDGAIQLSWANEAAGLKILNPTIPAGVNEMRVYVVADKAWDAGNLAVMGLIATADSDPNLQCRIDSLALHRLKRPHVPFPMPWNDGVVAMAGIHADQPWFEFAPAKPIQFAKDGLQHSATLSLKRLREDFKAGVALLPVGLPTGWSLAAKAEGDTYALTLNRSGREIGEPESLKISAFAEHAGRGRLVEYTLPIEWIDPVVPTLKFSRPLIAGRTVEASLSVARQGDDPQPLTVRFASLPAGLHVAPEPIALAANEFQKTVIFTAAADIQPNLVAKIECELVSQFAGVEWKANRTFEPPDVIAAPPQFDVYPSEITLTGKRDRQQLIVTGLPTDALPRDWTYDLELVSSDAAVAEVRDGVVYPITNGTAEIAVSLGAWKHVVPITVSGCEMVRPIQFENEVLVALSKQGCNSGACHGSPSGKGSFRLSLRAFDLNLDELTLLREDFGRRLNKQEPEESLLLLKPLMKVAHGGGKQIRETDQAYAILRDWIAEGAESDRVGTARCVRLEVVPNEKRTLNLHAGGQQLAATAHFADGTSRDVSHLVAYESTNNNVATVDVHGKVTPKGRGEAVILVRYLEHIRSIPLMFVEDVKGFEWQSPAVNNYVDTIVYEKLAKLKYQPASICDDSEFLRRVFLDVIGILPSPEETTAFLNDQDADKRSRLIDQLLERDEYAKFWALKWGDLLKMTSKLLGNDGVYKYHRWVETAFATNMPYDTFAKELITASGSTLSNPPANFYQTAKDMNECVENISQVFLGARLQCAKCHNHPFEHWTQDNYYGLGAFFQRVQRRGTQRPGETFVWASDTGEVTQPRTGQVMQPWLPGAGGLGPNDQRERRQAFADWLVEPDNPFFAKIEVNRIWSQLFARGIVDPIDDFRDSNPPTNGSLLDALAKDFAAHGYDRKHILKVMLNSRTYQAGYQTNEMNAADTLYFSHQVPRLLSAEQLLDAVNHVTGLTQQYGPAPDLVKVEFLKTFGQPERSTVCECEREDESNLGMAIELFNGSAIHEKLQNPANRFRKGVAEGKSVEDLVKELYLVALCRPPTSEEQQAALTHCQASSEPASGLEDVCWALLNSDEFLFQH